MAQHWPYLHKTVHHTIPVSLSSLVLGQWNLGSLEVIVAQPYPKIGQQTHLLYNTMLVPLHLDCGSNSPEVMDEELAHDHEADHLPRVDSVYLTL